MLFNQVNYQETSHPYKYRNVYNVSSLCTRFLFCRLLFDATAAIGLPKIKQNNPVHTLTSCFFCIFPPYLHVKIFVACPVSRIISKLQTFIVPFDFITKILFRKYLPSVLFVLLARQLRNLHLALQHSQIKHHYLTKLLFRSRVTMAHAYHRCTETRLLLDVYFGPQSQIEISVSNCSRAKRSIYAPTELSYWCRKKLHLYQ
jgi:hypothetical protein